MLLEKAKQSHQLPWLKSKRVFTRRRVHVVADVIVLQNAFYFHVMNLLVLHPRGASAGEPDGDQ
jgi:hypothetical protein